MSLTTVAGSAKIPGSAHVAHGTPWDRLADNGSSSLPLWYELGGEINVYAIISDGPHQYRVEEGQVFEVERKDLPEGAETFEFDRVLFVGDLPDGPKVGAPTVEGAKVIAHVEGEVKGEKLIIQKHRRRKNSSVKKGHRQKYLRLKIESIQV